MTIAASLTRTLTFACLLGTATPLVAREAPAVVRNATMANDTLTLDLGTTTAQLSAPSESSMQFVFQASGQPPALPSFALANPDSHTKATLTEQGNTLTFSTGKLTATIKKTPFAITYTYGGKTLATQTSGPAATPGFTFRISPGEHLYGAGSRALGSMNRRGRKLPLDNSPCYGYEKTAEKMYYSMPLAISSQKYGIIFDNSAKGEIDLDSDNTNQLRFSAAGGRNAYTIFAAPDWPAFTRELTDITGRQPLLPRWAWGNITSRMGYHSQEEVQNVAKLYADKDIPLDGLVLDLYWFGPDLKGHMGNLDWDRDHFPEPKKMMADLKAKGIHTMLITEPFVLTSSKRWQEASGNNVLATNADGSPATFEFFFGDTGIIDIFKPEARTWFWDIYRKHTLSGVDGWWGDLGEPEAHPDDIRHAIGSARDLHNTYGHSWAGLLAEGYEKDFPEKRPVILMRSGFVGSQRNGIVPWTGDVNRTWGGLTPQVEISLQMGLQGIAYMHSDLGGFAGDNKDAELYLRWLQYGVFQPIFRTHAQEDVPPEPVFWDDATMSNAREQIRLRARMLPYNYTLMWENSTTGMPLMRPLMFADPSPALLSYQDAYTWGDAFLVSPVTEPGQTRKAIRFPAGATWFNFWSGTRHQGGREETINIPTDNIPVFVKAGAVIPMAPTATNAASYDSSKLELHYHADPSVANVQSHLYDDDGSSPNAISKNQYDLITFGASQRGNSIQIQAKAEAANAYPGKPASRSFTYLIHQLAKPPAKVLLNDQPNDFQWDQETRTLSIPITWKGEPTTLKILE